MLKKPAKATSFYSDSRDRTFNILSFGKRLAGHSGGHWSGFFIISASQMIIIFTTDGLTFIIKKA